MRLRESTAPTTTNTLSCPAGAFFVCSRWNIVIASAAAVAFVEERRRRDVHAGQILHDRLEVQQRFEPALGDLGLVRRVGRVPAGILEHVAQDDRGRDAVVVADGR